MQKRLYIMLLVSLCIGLCGCANFSRVNANWRNFEQIKVGMSKGDVIYIMGAPDDKDVFLLENGTCLEFLKYFRDYNITGITLNSDTQPICVQDDQVIGIGHKFCNCKRKEIKSPLYKR